MVRYKMPPSLGMPSVLRICSDLAELSADDHYEINFSDTQHFEPFGMLLAGAAVRRLGSGEAQVSLVGRDDSKQGHDYARRMGFWLSIGDLDGFESVSTTSTDRTIPVTRLGVDELYRQSGGVDPIRSETVSRAAGEIATTLCGGDTDSPLWLALEYSFRELFRNVIEHSRADAIWYTASTRPSQDDVQVAILDSGRGIRESLADSPYHIHTTDRAAIDAALRPGVSRNEGVERSPEQTRRILEEHPGQDPSLYDNSGYGLTVTATLCQEAGQFTVVSGKTSLAFVGRVPVESETSHNGTAIRFVLAPSRLSEVLQRAFDLADQSSTRPRSRSRVTASMLTRLGMSRRH